MRPKVLLSALLIGGIMVGIAVWLAGISRPPASPPLVAETPPANQTIAPLINTNSPHPKISPAFVRTNETPPPDLSDPINAILADLENPDRELRQSALQRSRDLDDRSIIPRLREVAGRTDDPREKADIQDTIDFLNLPDISENMVAAHAARVAAGLPDPPQSPTNRWTGQPFHPQQQ